MTTLENKVEPLDYRVAIADSNGAPTPEFQRKWNAQRTANGTIPDLTTAKAVSAVIDLFSKTWGSLLVRGQYQWTGMAPSADGKVLRDKGTGATPIWDTISSILDTYRQHARQCALSRRCRLGCPASQRRGQGAHGRRRGR
jgi:hypothetical protein